MIRFNRFSPSLVLAVMAALLLVLSSQASPREQGRCAIHEQLTQEQRAEMHQRMLELWSEGATPEDIHETITDMVKGYGIDIPDDCRHGRRVPGGLPMFGHGPGRFTQNLSEEQRAELHQKMLELWSDGATHEEIREASVDLLKGYGVEVPENCHFGRGKHGFGRGHGPGRFMQDLTEEQRAEVREEMSELWNQGSTPEEIHEAVAQKLKGHGVDLPEHGRHGRGMRGFGPGHGPGRIMQDLTEEQRAEVREEMSDLWSQGSTPEEIHEAVAQKLQGYGVDVPEQGRGGRGMRGFGPGHGPGRFMQDLTEEQRAEVREQMKTLWEQGATPQEMHENIAELMKGYGIELPGHGRFGQCKPGATPGLGPSRYMDELTTEQRVEVRDRILTMWTAGSTHDEIQDSVNELLKGYGIDVNQNELGAASGEDADTVPTDLRLTVEASPNPFGEQTYIEYNLPDDANVRVDVFDLNGQVIRSFDIGNKASGTHRVVWDGTDETGNVVTNGPYLCRVQADEYEATSRVMLIR